MEIEFRGISLENGQFIYGDLYHGLNGLIYINTIVQLSEKSKCNEQILVHFETVGQYTGLKDKNGVKIFEGDIIEGYHSLSTKFKGNVYYKKGCFYVNDGVKEGNISLGWLIENSIKFNIIGNIHHHKELLK